MTLCAVTERVCNISAGSRPTAVRPPGHFCQISALWLPQCILLFSPLQRVRTHPNAVPLACSCFLCWCLSQVHPQGTFPQYQPTSNQPTMLFQISFLTPIVLSVVCRCRIYQGEFWPSTPSLAVVRSRRWIRYRAAFTNRFPALAFPLHCTDELRVCCIAAQRRSKSSERCSQM